MNFAFSDEQQQLREVVRRFLDEQSPAERVRELMEADRPFDEELWGRMATQLGLQGLHLPEEFGGSGYGMLELVVVMEEMGRRLPCVPYFSSAVLASLSLLHAGDDASRKELLPALATGERAATLALLDGASGSWDPADVELVASPVDGGWELAGTKRHVLEAQLADLLLVVARTERGVSLFAVEADAAGIVREDLTTMDLTRRQSHVTFEGTPARLVSEEGGALDGLRLAQRLAIVALAAEQVGGAQACLDSSVAYAKERIQFGRPIGSFQAVKHKCADMLLQVESARSAAYYAGWAAATLDEDLPIATSMAKSYCSDAFTHCAGDNIQVHGGIGFTWEHSAHLYFKRAKSAELLFGDPAEHREQLAELLEL